MTKRQLCDHIIAKMEWWRHAAWADHIDVRTKNEVIDVMQNIVANIANHKQTYGKGVMPLPEPPKEGEDGNVDI